MSFSEKRVKGPYSETDTKKIFEDNGIDWETRSERFKIWTPANSPFAEIEGQWWIAYRENGEPVSAQGIGPYGDFNLLLGLKSFPKEGEKGYGSGIASYVVKRHSGKPIIGSATEGGMFVFPKLGFKTMNFEGERPNAVLQNEEDLPDKLKSALEMVYNANISQGIRKFFYLSSPSWWYILKEVKE